MLTSEWASTLLAVYIKPNQYTKTLVWEFTAFFLTIFSRKGCRTYFILKAEKQMSSTRRHVVPREEPWPTESWKWKQERVLLPPTPQTTDASLPGETHLLIATEAAASHLHIQKKCTYRYKDYQRCKDSCSDSLLK